jgi:hypothetical protein
MRTDAQVLTAWRFGAQSLERTWKIVSRQWLLVVIAVVIFAAFLVLARSLATYTEKLLAPFIKNVIIYKEILINSSASPTSQATFAVLMPYEASTTAAIAAITQVISERDEILAEPAPRVLIEAMETNGIRLRAYYWVPVEGVDGLKLLSDLRLKSKVALQQAGIAPPPMGVPVSVVGRVPVELLEGDGRPQPQASLRPRVVVTPEQAEFNLHRDKKAAESLTAVPANGETTIVDHVMKTPHTHVKEEGTNLLVESDPPKPAQPQKI